MSVRVQRPKHWTFVTVKQSDDNWKSSVCFWMHTFEEFNKFLDTESLVLLI